jgi:hypothetical protein
MLSYPRYLIERRHLSAQLRAAYKADDLDVARKKASGATASEIYDLKGQQAQENWIIEDELQQLESRFLCLQAHKYRVPIPPHKEPDLWEESSSIGGWQLTAKGFAMLRADLRKEKNERWQWWELRTKVLVALATALTGLVGALIGWAAFFPRK